MNSKLVELAEKDSIYEEVAPMLFGDQFAKEAKRERPTAGPGQGYELHHTLSEAAEFSEPWFLQRGRNEPKPLRLPVWSRKGTRKGTLPTIPIQSSKLRKRELCPEGERIEPVKKETN